MSDNPTFDFWYAVNNTRVVLMPRGRLETFGATVVNYHLVSELMDRVDRVRVREGQVKAHRPEIITPQAYAQTLLEGFGDEARKYADWLREHEQDMAILRYGFVIGKQELSEHIVSDRLEPVLEQVRESVAAKDDPLSAVVLGVDQPWEVCLIKLMTDVIRHSIPGNVQDLHRKHLIGPDAAEHQLRSRIDEAFQTASRDASEIPALSAMLKSLGVWEEYQDRFFALVRSHNR